MFLKVGEINRQLLLVVVFLLQIAPLQKWPAGYKSPINLVSLLLEDLNCRLLVIELHQAIAAVHTSLLVLGDLLLHLHVFHAAKALKISGDHARCVSPTDAPDEYNRPLGVLRVRTAIFSFKMVPIPHF